MIGYYSRAIQVVGPSLWLKFISLELLFFFYVCFPHSLVFLTIWHNHLLGILFWPRVRSHGYCRMLRGSSIERTPYCSGTNWLSRYCFQMVGVLLLCNLIGRTKCFQNRAFQGLISNHNMTSLPVLLCQSEPPPPPPSPSRKAVEPDKPRPTPNPPLHAPWRFNVF